MIIAQALAETGLLTHEATKEVLTKGLGNGKFAGQKVLVLILDHTPMGRLGNPEDLLGCVLWLLSPASSFVTGITVPVDGGFSAYAGV
jgi:NAD(P)-dependent dehydrogenase (short-subunit alcohol dehydrogenase family)